MLPALVLLASFFSPQTGNARTLVTPNYTVTVSEKCTEYDLGCSNVEFHSVSRSGKTLTLRGTQVMAMCKDGVTPCHALGYRFANRGFTYLVSETGELTVKHGVKTLVDEQGKWQGE